MIVNLRKKNFHLFEGTFETMLDRHNNVYRNLKKIKGKLLTSILAGEQNIKRHQLIRKFAKKIDTKLQLKAKLVFAHRCMDPLNLMLYNIDRLDQMSLI